MELQTIVQFLEDTFHPSQLSDFPNALNGLQVSNAGQVHKVAGAVDANPQSIRAAIDCGADLLCVHHGLFWSGLHPFVDHYYTIYRDIFNANLAIYSLHLPLDSHPQWSHNATIAQRLNLSVDGTFAHYMHQACGLVCTENLAIATLQQRVQTLFPRSCHALLFGPSQCSKIGIASGSGGMDLLQASVEAHIDTLITGEVKYSAVTFAQQHELNIFACGHYATECFGVQNMLQLLHNKFHLPCQFLDLFCEL